MTLIRDVEWDACVLEPRRDPELERRVRELGGLVVSARYLAPLPWLAERVAQLQAALCERVHVSHRVADLIGLAVSQDNSCRYCFAAQRTLLQMSGYSADRLARIEQDVLSAGLAPDELAAYEFARRLSRSNPAPGAAELDALAEAGFHDAAIREIAAHTVLNAFFNRLSTLPALPPEPMESLTERWYVRPFLPLVGRLRARQLWRRVPEHLLSAAAASGPFEWAIRAINGVPAAVAIRRLLDELFESSLLPARLRGLIFAVVARALGCESSEDEARARLSAEGVDEKLIDEVLAHLTAEDLDSLERVSLRLARESVWYRPVQLQRRARDVRGAIPVAQFLDLVATIAIANAVCRLAVVAELGAVAPDPRPAALA